MNIEIINPIDYPNWDGLLLTNPAATFFHTSAWAQVLAESYKYKPLYFSIIDNKKLSALIALMEIKSFLTGNRGVSLPFTDECAPIVSDPEQQEAFIEAVIRHGKTAGWSHFELKGGNAHFTGKAHSSFYTHTLDLTQGANEIFSAFRNSNKRNIKRALREDLQVDIRDSLESMRSFYQLNCLTRKLHGLPPQPWHFFKKIHEHIISAKNGFVALARVKEKIIAGAVYFHFNGRAIFKYGASDRRDQHLRPNNLVMWRAIQWCIEHGCRQLSLGRTEIRNEGLLQFKRGWRGKEENLQYFKYDFKKCNFIIENQSFMLSQPFFKLLPSLLSRWTGNILYRHVG